MNPPFINGLRLSELFYTEAVKPILNRHFPKLEYSAGLIGTGSEVLGFDTPQSMDHDWGPRLMLFLSEADHAVYHFEIDRVLRRELVHEIHGYPTNLAVIRSSRARDTVVQADGIAHSVMLLTTRCFFKSVLNFDPTAEIRVIDWVAVPEYYLLAESWKEREQQLAAAYELVARMHNDLQITASLPVEVSPYYDRPFFVIHADRFVESIHAAITSAEVRALPEHLGAIDQFVDSTDALDYHARFKALYEPANS